MRILSIIVSSLIVILVVTFTVLNSTLIINSEEVHSIPINLIFLDQPVMVNLALALVVAFGLGALIGIISATLIIIKLRRANNRLEKKLVTTMPNVELKNSLSAVEREAH